LRGLSGSGSRQFLWSLAVSKVRNGLVGFFRFINVSLERHPEQRFDSWLCGSLLIFCKDSFFFGEVANHWVTNNGLFQAVIGCCFLDSHFSCLLDKISLMERILDQLPMSYFIFLNFSLVAWHELQRHFLFHLYFVDQLESLASEVNELPHDPSSWCSPEGFCLLMRQFCS
jgi:hypothetical protein